MSDNISIAFTESVGVNRFAIDEYIQRPGNLLTGEIQCQVPSRGLFHVSCVGIGNDGQQTEGIAVFCVNRADATLLTGGSLEAKPGISVYRLREFVLRIHSAGSCNHTGFTEYILRIRLEIGGKIVAQADSNRFLAVYRDGPTQAQQQAQQQQVLAQQQPSSSPFSQPQQVQLPVADQQPQQLQLSPVDPAANNAAELQRLFREYAMLVERLAENQARMNQIFLLVQQQPQVQQHQQPQQLSNHTLDYMYGDADDNALHAHVIAPLFMELNNTNNNNNNNMNYFLNNIDNNNDDEEDTNPATPSSDHVDKIRRLN